MTHAHPFLYQVLMEPLGIQFEMLLVILTISFLQLQLYHLVSPYVHTSIYLFYLVQDKLEPCIVLISLIISILVHALCSSVESSVNVLV